MVMEEAPQDSLEGKVMGPGIMGLVQRTRIITQEVVKQIVVVGVPIRIVPGIIYVAIVEATLVRHHHRQVAQGTLYANNSASN